MTRDHAEAHIAARFDRTGIAQSPRNTSTHRVWTETWVRRDGNAVTGVDLTAFEAVPRGQGHRVTVAGHVVTLHCELDSGD